MAHPEEAYGWSQYAVLALILPLPMAPAIFNLSLLFSPL